MSFVEPEEALGPVESDHIVLGFGVKGGKPDKFFLDSPLS